MGDESGSGRSVGLLVYMREGIGTTSKIEVEGMPLCGVHAC